MNKKIHFQGMESSAAIENYISEHIEKIEKFLSDVRDPVFIDFTVRPGRPHAHSQAELRIKTPYDHIIVQKEGAEPYKLIDIVIDEAYEALQEAKRKRVDEDRTIDHYKSA